MICEPVYDLEEAVFSDVVVEATVPLGFSRKHGAHEDDRGTLKMRQAPYPAAQFYPVHTGHHVVRNDGVWCALRQLLQRLFAATGRDHVEAIVLQ